MKNKEQKAYEYYLANKDLKGSKTELMKEIQRICGYGTIVSAYNFIRKMSQRNEDNRVVVFKNLIVIDGEKSIDREVMKKRICEPGTSIVKVPAFGFIENNMEVSFDTFLEVFATQIADELKEAF